MFILFNGDPNAWKALREQNLASNQDRTEYRPSLSELLSVAARGYQTGLTWKLTCYPARAIEDDVRKELYDCAMVEGLKNFCWSIWNAWHAGFEQGIKENPHIIRRDCSCDERDCFVVLPTPSYDPRCTCTFGPIS